LPRETVTRYVPSGNVPETEATISVDVAETIVSGKRSNVTISDGEWPRPSWPSPRHRKFCPVITRRLFDSSRAALVITSCCDDGDGVAAAGSARENTISAANPRTVVDTRLKSNIFEPPVSPLRFARWPPQP
jgi:hypothetical protein